MNIEYVLFLFFYFHIKIFWRKRHFCDVLSISQHIFYSMYKKNNFSVLDFFVILFGTFGPIFELSTRVLNEQIEHFIVWFDQKISILKCDLQ